MTQSQGETLSGDDIISDEITILSPDGFHARPAARLVAAAKGFKSAVKLLHGESSCNAKSIVSVMGMALNSGDKLRIEATGPDAEEAIRTLTSIIAETESDSPNQ